MVEDGHKRQSLNVKFASHKNSPSVSLMSYARQDILFAEGTT